MQKVITVMERSVTFRCTQEDVNSWQSVAEERDVSLGELIRTTMNGLRESETPAGEASEN